MKKYVLILIFLIFFSFIVFSIIQLEPPPASYNTTNASYWVINYTIPEPVQNNRTFLGSFGIFWNGTRPPANVTVFNRSILGNWLMNNDTENRGANAITYNLTKKGNTPPICYKNIIGNEISGCNISGQSSFFMVNTTNTAEFNSLTIPRTVIAKIYLRQLPSQSGLDDYPIFGKYAEWFFKISGIDTALDDPNTLRASGHGGNNCIGATTLRAQEWYCVGWTFNGTHSKIYLNGSVDCIISATTLGGGNGFSNHIKIGCHDVDTGCSTQGANMTIDWMRFYWNMSISDIEFNASCNLEFSPDGNYSVNITGLDNGTNYTYYGWTIFNNSIPNSTAISYIKYDTSFVSSSVNTEPSVTLNLPANDTVTHNKTQNFNFTIEDNQNDLFNYSLFLDCNIAGNPTTQINRSFNRTNSNFTFISTYNTETSGSINGTCYWKVNGSDNNSNSFVSPIRSFNLTNNRDNTTNVTINDTSIELEDVLRGYFNQTSILSNGRIDYDNYTMNQTRWYINFTEMVSARNETILLGTNTTNGANVTFSARTNDGYGETGWTYWKNSTTITVGDTSIPTISNANFSVTSITGGGVLFNVTVNVSDNGIIFEINATARDPNGILNNGSCGNLNTNLYICNISQTSIVGTWNLTRATAMDTSNNLIVSFPNVTLIVSSLPDSGGGNPPASAGGGGGGGCPPGLTADAITGECKNATIIFSKNLSIIPTSNIDTFFLFTTFQKKDVEWRYLLKANKVLNECIVTGNFECKIAQKSDVLLTSKQKNPNYFTKIEKGNVKIIDLDGQVSFRQVILRSVNLSYSLPFAPFKGSFIIIIIPAFSLLIIYRKTISFYIKKILSLKVKN